MPSTRYNPPKSAKMRAKIEVKQNKASKNAYVLVLVDGHSHQLTNSLYGLYGTNGNGGFEAAQLFEEAVTKQIPQHVGTTNGYRLVVRIYADIKGLSYLISSAGLVGRETRALATFAAAFSSAKPGFDFVDVIDEKCVCSKIVDSFKAAIEDETCTHVFLGIPPKMEYQNMLAEYSGKHNKMNLVQGGYKYRNTTHPIIRKVEFPKVFRAENIGLKAPNYQATEEHEGRETLVEQRGKMQTRGAMEITTATSSDSGSINRPHPTQIQHVPIRVSKTVENLLRVSTQLPVQPMPGMMPVNRYRQRLDIYISKPTRNQWEIWYAHLKTGHPCNKLYMEHGCYNKDCPFDHKPLKAASLRVLRYIHKATPCRDGSRCRREHCYMGHVCQDSKCKEGRKVGCKFDAEMHKIKKRLFAWISPDGKTVIRDDPQRKKEGVTPVEVHDCVPDDRTPSLLSCNTSSSPSVSIRSPVLVESNDAAEMGAARHADSAMQPQELGRHVGPALGYTEQKGSNDFAFNGPLI